MNAARRFLFMVRSGPADDSRLKEALDMILTAAAFEQCVRLLFVDEGVRHLTMDSAVASPHDDEVRGMLEALDVYDVREVLVGLESLAVRGLAAGDCRIAITALPEALIPALIAEHDRLQVV